MIREFDVVRLTEEVEGLRAGETGAVVMIHDDGAAFEVEFIGHPGETFAIRAGQLEPVTE